MASRPGRELAVGTLFALALVILALAIMAVGGESQLFVSQTHYRTRFPSADGLSVGSPVRMAGVQVGAVSSILLPTDPKDTGIQVQISIDEAYAGRVRQDSGAKLRTLLYLSGEKFVEVSPGSPDRPQLPEGAEIPLVADKEILEQGQDIAGNLNEITISLRNILARLEKGEGLIGEMLTDPKFGKEGLESLRASLDNAAQISSDLILLRPPAFRGDGAVGRLLYDEELGRKLDTLGQAVEDFSSLMATVNKHEGALGELLEEGGAGQQAIVDLRDAAATLKVVAERLESPEGMLGRLLHDPEYSEALAQDLRGALRDLAEITAKINRGEGSLGALINDRTLYDGAQEIVDGAKDSKFTRWMLRRYRKKGVKAAEEQGQQEERQQDQ